MKILLFGGGGQLGFELIKRARDLNFEVVAPVLSEVDICNADQVNFIADRVRPDVTINAAAYTAVDNAERDRAAAFAVNADGPRVIATAVRRTCNYLIHVSTDYVFDGGLGRLLTEEDVTNPLNVYGESKLAGEVAVHETLPDSSLVVRTASLHGQRGENFVHTMLKLFDEREVVRVVSDQYMSPTWAGWLAEAILDLAKIRPTGVVHGSGNGVASWFEFAQAIYEFGRSQRPEGWCARLEAIPTSELTRPARRPQWTGFDTSKIAGLLGRPAMGWQEGLRNHLRDIGRLR